MIIHLVLIIMTVIESGPQTLPSRLIDSWTFTWLVAPAYDCVCLFVFSVFTWGDRWQDDDFLGPREEADGSEVLAPDPFLEKHINANSDATEKSRGSRFASQRQAILASEKKAMNQREKQRNKKKNDEDDDDDDVSVDEDESENVTLWVDSTREEQFKKDIDCMKSDLVATEKPLLRKRLSIKTRLKLELRARKLSRTQQLYSEPLVGDQTQPNQQPTPEPEPESSKDLQLTKKASSPAEKKSKKRPTKGAKKKPRPVNYFFGSPDAPLNVMKKWGKCPDFEEFFQYLGGMSENGISSARGRQRNSKEKLKPGESTDSFCSLDTGGTTSCAVETAVLSKEEDTDKLGRPQEKTAVCKKSALRSAGNKGEDTAESTKGSVKRRVSYKEDEIEESKKDLTLHKTGHKEKEEMAEPGGKSPESTLDCKEETARSGNGSVKLGVSYEDVTREPTKEGKADYKDGEEMTESIEKPDTHKIHYKDGKETAESEQKRGTSKKSKNTTVSEKHNEQMHTYTNSRLELPETEFLTCLSERIMQHLRDGQRGMASRAYTPSGTHLLTEKQETFLQDEGLIVNRMDPWQVSVRFAYLDGGVADSIGVRSDRQRRRDRIYRLLEEGKLILKLNESRLWSLVRQVPKEKRMTKLRSDNTEKRTNNGPGRPGPGYAYAKNKIRGKSSICDDRDATEGETPRATRGDSEFQSDPYPENSNIQLRSNPPLSAEAKRCDTKSSKRMSTDLSGDSGHLQWPDSTGKTLKGSAVKRRRWDRVSQSGPQNGTLTFIDDSEIPDSITEQDLFTKMQVGKKFDIGKLKSTYSFEKFFGYRMKSVPKYSQRLAKYQHPLTKKKTKDVPKSAEKKKKPPKLPEVEEDKEKEEEVVAEVPTPPMIVGKLKEYRFLQHKDYIPSPMKVEDSQRAEITADELFDYLLLALQVCIFLCFRKHCLT